MAALASPKVSEFCSESHSIDGGVSSAALPSDCSYMSDEDADVDEDVDEDADADMDEDADEDADVDSEYV